MKVDSYTDKATLRTQHIEDHLRRGFDVSLYVHNIENSEGSPKGSAMRLSSHAFASAMHSWFSEHDMSECKRWCYVGGRLNQFWYQMQDESLSPGTALLDLFLPLLSDCEELIQWFADYDRIFYPKRIDNHKTLDFWAYQSRLALRGEMTRLRERCERAIEDPPTASNHKKHLVDFHFYLGLANGDVEKMESSLREMTTPRAISGRKNEESGYTEDLISTPAVIYAKMAARLGYQLKLDSPYIPSEWLPVTCLDHYESPYTFLSD
ncbi:UNVERIFIED_ORG: hypothetical protein J2Y81_005728 [Paraburkholderia sediminicola]|nr:hypothetical protein [Paraburkholderia sediminicola]